MIRWNNLITNFSTTVCPAAGYTVITYDEFVCSLVKEMGSETLNVLHAAIGIAGEGGELLDAAKKHWAYNKPLDRANVIEELGDLEFYMTAMRQVLGISRQTVLDTNCAKLAVRYAAGYSDAAAIARADKPGENQEKPGEKQEKQVIISGVSQAINLSSAQVAAVDKTAELAAKALGSFESTVTPAEELLAPAADSSNHPVAPRP